MGKVSLGHLGAGDIDQPTYTGHNYKMCLLVVAKGEFTGEAYFILSLNVEPWLCCFDVVFPRAIFCGQGQMCEFRFLGWALLTPKAKAASEDSTAVGNRYIQVPS